MTAGGELRDGLAQWSSFYSGQRFHQGLDNMTPDEVYFDLSHFLPWLHDDDADRGSRL
ncbi:uncharacterized protein Dmul_22510 [Desulfococcus multivorans]|nr:uncharacterized protein Dmul_22510 [Desulfococcus multivorans]